MSCIPLWFKFCLSVFITLLQLISLSIPSLVFSIFWQKIIHGLLSKSLLFFLNLQFRSHLLQNFRLSFSEFNHGFIFWVFVNFGPSLHFQFKALCFVLCAFCFFVFFCISLFLAFTFWCSLNSFCLPPI